ncbi:MAG: family 20 glycosylhydrolase [Victivallaceae bacterium]|nr:family 20 glycosylhydrolase [Victivallaceae bacterium]
MKSSFRFRGVQLDLARQVETLEFIKQFTDIIAANGYNVLFLYLEGRVRTESFPYPTDNECYTLEQMCEIIEYASSKGIDVVPGISLLGHGELFLKHEELAELAELRDGRNGRFWANHKHVFCPSQKATCEFFEKYLKEICAIFPSEYIHIGLDEVWDIGYCEKCKEQAVDFMGEQSLFLNHLLHCHKILTSFGKRVMMWDDMFEYYRDILEKVPRDVIMVNWQYYNDVQHYRGHFTNLKTEHILAEYDRLGFEYIIAPSDYSSANVRTFTEYSENFKPLGALITTWEKETCFLYKSMPTIAYAGRLWSDETGKPEDELFTDAMENLFRLRDEKIIAILRFNTERTLDNEIPVSLSALLTTKYHGFDYGGFEALNLLRLNLENILKTVKNKLGKIIIQDIIDACYYNIFKYRLHKFTQDLFDPMGNTEKAELEINKIYQDVKTFGKTRVQKWNDYRPGIKPCHIAKLHEKYLELIKSLPEQAKNNGIMRVRFCLPDGFSAEHCKISLKYSGSWHDISIGCYKGLNSEDVLFTKTFLIPSSVVPEVFRMEACGYGGQGLTFVEIFTNTGSYVPSVLISATGRVTDPEYVLDNDCKWCFIGEKDTLKAFKNRKVAEEIHSVEYSF